MHTDLHNPTVIDYNNFHRLQVISKFGLNERHWHTQDMNKSHDVTKVGIVPP